MDNEEVQMTAGGAAAAPRMSRADALSVLANLAQKRDTTLEEVVAIQIAVRNVAKRMFDRERNFKRKRAKGEAACNTPPDSLDVAGDGPSEEGGDHA